MKRTACFLTILFLAACAPAQLSPTPIPPTPTATIPVATETPAPTSTPLPTIAATESAPAAEVGVNIDRPLDVGDRVDYIENVVGPHGSFVNGGFALDASVTGPGANEIIVSDALGRRLLSEWVAVMNGVDPEDTQTMAEFEKKLAQVQRGELPCSEVQATVWGYDANVPGLEQQPFVLEFFCGEGQVSPGAQRIDSIMIDFVEGSVRDPATGLYVPRKDMPRFNTTSKGGGAGFETIVDPASRTLHFMVGKDMMSLADTGRTPATGLAELPTWIRLNKGNGAKFDSNNNYLRTGDSYLADGYIVR